MAALVILSSRPAGNAAQVAPRIGPQTTERIAASITTRVAPESDLPVTLRTGIRFTAEIGRPVAMRIGPHNDLRITAEVAAGEAVE